MPRKHAWREGGTLLLEWCIIARPQTDPLVGKSNVWPTQSPKERTMSSETAEPRATQAGEESYTISDETVQREYVQVRRAAQWVPFFLPHLKPGMSLLDCG